MSAEVGAWAVDFPDFDVAVAVADECGCRLEKIDDSDDNELF